MLYLPKYGKYLPGLNEALQPSWEGPYEINGVAGPMSYEIKVNGKKKCVHIKFLKEWHGKTVKRVTTTLEDDTESDELGVTNQKVQVEVRESDSVFQKKLETLVKGYTDVLCDEPGLTEMVELEIDTEDALYIQVPIILQCL